MASNLLAIRLAFTSRQKCQKHLALRVCEATDLDALRRQPGRLRVAPRGALWRVSAVRFLSRPPPIWAVTGVVDVFVFEFFKRSTCSLSSSWLFGQIVQVRRSGGTVHSLIQVGE